MDGPADFTWILSIRFEAFDGEAACDSKRADSLLARRDVVRLPASQAELAIGNALMQRAIQLRAIGIDAEGCRFQLRSTAMPAIQRPRNDATRQRHRAGHILQRPPDNVAAALRLNWRSEALARLTDARNGPPPQSAIIHFAARGQDGYNLAENLYERRGGCQECSYAVCPQQRVV